MVIQAGQQRVLRADRDAHGDLSGTLAGGRIPITAQYDCDEAEKRRMISCRPEPLSRAAARRACWHSSSEPALRRKINHQLASTRQLLMEGLHYPGEQKSAETCSALSFE